MTKEVEEFDGVTDFKSVRMQIKEGSETVGFVNFPREMFRTRRDVRFARESLHRGSEERGGMDLQFEAWKDGGPESVTFNDIDDAMDWAEIVIFGEVKSR